MVKRWWRVSHIETIRDYCFRCGGGTVRGHKWYCPLLTKRFLRSCARK